MVLEAEGSAREESFERVELTEDLVAKLEKLRPGQTVEAEMEEVELTQRPELTPDLTIER